MTLQHQSEFKILFLHFPTFFWGEEGRFSEVGGKVVEEGIKVARSSSYTEAKGLTR